MLVYATLINATLLLSDIEEKEEYSTGENIQNCVTHVDQATGGKLVVCKQETVDRCNINTTEMKALVYL